MEWPQNVTRQVKCGSNYPCVTDKGIAPGNKFDSCPDYKNKFGRLKYHPYLCIMKNKENLEYWFCKIGPIDRSEIPDGGDGPLRSAVEDKFIDMFGEQAKTCGSGWGLKEEMKTRLDIISYLHITDPSGEMLKQIDEILSKRPMI